MLSSRMTKARQMIHKHGVIYFLKKAFRHVQYHVDKFQAQRLAALYIRGFHKVTYYLKTFTNSQWLGIPSSKCPLDLWIYQEILYETRPDFVIETGTLHGGSALFFASIFDLIGHGHVITVDIKDRMTATHPRITKFIGDSISDIIIESVSQKVGNQSAMVVLDSDHSKAHVLKELELYSQFVSKGNYLVVEDTNINGHPVFHAYGEGPMEAVYDFLASRDDFIIDRHREHFLMTYFPSGFLKRKV